VRTKEHYLVCRSRQVCGGYRSPAPPVHGGGPHLCGAMDVEASRPRPRRHSLGDPPARRGANIASEDPVALQREAISRTAPEGRKLSTGGSPNDASARPSGAATHKRRRSAGARRRSKGG
ncbi:unnamed protein product, partial [Scytosiphon promiscuus]